MANNLTDNAVKLQQKAVATKDGLALVSDPAARARPLLHDLYTSSPVSAR